MLYIFFRVDHIEPGLLKVLTWAARGTSAGRENLSMNDRVTYDSNMKDVRAHPGHLWEERYETIRKMHASGIKLVVSSDQGSTGTRINELSLLMEFLTQEIQLPAADVLYGVTGLAAEACGLEDRVGTLEPGGGERFPRRGDGLFGLSSHPGAAAGASA